MMRTHSGPQMPDPDQTCWPSDCGSPDGGIPQIPLINKLFWIHLVGYVLSGCLLLIIFIITVAVSLSMTFHQKSGYRSVDLFSREMIIPDDTISLMVFVYFLFFVMIPIFCWTLGGYCSVVAFRLGKSIQKTPVSDVEIQAPGAPTSVLSPNLLQALVNDIGSWNIGQFTCFWVNLGIAVLQAISL